MIIDTFSKRQKRLKGECTDIFKYDELPISLRVQTCRLWTKCLGKNTGYGYGGGQNPAYEYLHECLATEFGLFTFPHTTKGDSAAIAEFFLIAPIEQALDMIDVIFRYAVARHSDKDLGGRRDWITTFDVEMSCKEAIEDLNTRFLEHGVGYAFVNDELPQLIKRDNEHLHTEAVLPALRLLHEEGFSGANEEYRKAHEHYLHGAQKECLNECLKAFESTMKTICTKKKWPYKETDTASALIDTCLQNGLLPTFMQAHLGTIKSALETAIPTVRNKLGGHGQGIQPKIVPPFYAEFLLHETATAIVFLVDAFKTTK